VCYFLSSYDDQRKRVITFLLHRHLSYNEVTINTVTRVLIDLKLRTISENRAWVDDSKLAFKFLRRNSDKFDSNSVSSYED